MDPQSRREAAVNAIGYIPQSLALYRGLTIRDHLTMAEAARPSFDRIHALHRIEAAGLGEKRKVGELSGGEQAQVALAVALGTRAPLLLLDEPIASLDPLARREFLTAMSFDVRERRATAVVASHLIVDVDQICDWLVVLAEGRLQLTTSIAEAKDRFSVVAADPDRKEIVGSFSDPGGSTMVLIEGRAGRPATLEEIVLAHMAAARSRRRESAA
jgi:ABC-2 type transport system ATP-binding protein